MGIFMTPAVMNIFMSPPPHVMGNFITGGGVRCAPGPSRELVFALPIRQAASAGAAWVHADWAVFLFGLVRILANGRVRTLP